LLLILALNTIAKPIIVASIDEPPYDMIGSGDPTIGSNPVTIAIFMVTYKKIEKAKLKQNNLAKWLLEMIPM